MQTESAELHSSGEKPPTQCAPRNRWWERFAALMVAVAAAILYFAGLGKTSLLDWDEAIYAEISKQSLRMHEWLTPYWAGRPFFEKSPLTFWIRTLLFRLFGISEFWARAESALAGVAIVLLTFALVRCWWGTRAALFAAFILMTMREFDHSVRQAMCDAPLCLCIYLALYAYVRLCEGDKRWWYGICAAIGLGVMVKGPAIVIAPAAIVIDRIYRRHESWPVHRREYVLGGLLVLLIAAPWHMWMWWLYGDTFLREYAGYQVVARTFGVLDGNRGGPLFYFAAIGRGAFPWSLLVPVAALRWLRLPDWEHRLPWIVVLVTFGLYTLVTTKILHYVTPLYPALAMVLGRMLADITSRRRLLRFAAVALVASGVLITFTKFVTFAGFPAANAKAQLSRIAHAHAHRGTLLLLQRYDSDADLSNPAAMFYSDRPAIALDIPNYTDLFEDYVQSHASADAILEKAVLPQLPASYRVRPVAEDGELIYAVITPAR